MIQLKKSKQSRLKYVVLFLAMVTTLVSFMFFAAVIRLVSDIAASQKERASLLKVTKILEKKNIGTFDAEMRNINPDYICWLKIEGTSIDYPVVRGNDNEKYLHMSFYGEENMLGTLFMDYRCVGRYVPNIIIYGHNSRHGDMFGGLRKFLDKQYLNEHPVITIKVNDRIVEYEIFSARKTDIHDPAYALDFSEQGSFNAFAEKCGAPSDPWQIITLSTCVSGDDEDERVLVQGVLRDEKNEILQ